MKNLIKYTPFILIIVMFVVANYLNNAIEVVKPFVLIFVIHLTLNYLVALKLKIKNHFLCCLTAVSLLGSLSVFVFPNIGQLYLNHILTSLYIGLLLAAIIPVILNQELFTYEFSKGTFPKTIVNSDQFYKINLILNIIWGMLFAIAIPLSWIQYSPHELTNTLVSTLAPLALLLAIGVPVTLKLPDYLSQRIVGKPIIFKTITELFETMPYGLNREKAKGMDTVIQFFLSGKEATTGYLSIKNQICHYTEGTHQTPNTTIRCDSELWLQISNKEVKGDVTYLNHEFKVEGDAGMLLKIDDLFTPGSEEKTAFKAITYDYKTFEPHKIKNIVVFDGGFRNTKFSKTSFMVNNFIKGAKESGANVEYFKLKDYNIKDCTGCYTCWSKTPGECIFRDDMTELRKKYREADLVVLASPLYIFNVSGILKTFMDRLLPIMKPYMLMNEKEDIMHPDRFPEKGEQGFLVFSAAGFPEVAHNFDGLIGMFRAWNSHNENTHLMGEFYLPAAELIAHDVYKERKDLVQNLCITAGKQIVENGGIDKSIMASIQNPQVSKGDFQQQADTFWKNLDGKKAYLKNTPKL